MGKKASKASQVLSRGVKAVVAILLVPALVGLSQGLSAELSKIQAADGSALKWFLWGVVGYAGFHLLLYRAKGLFRLSHAVLERLAIWLFGGQVATVGSEGAAAAAKAPKAKSKRGKDSSDGDGESAPPQESTLVVISPYLVPAYVLLLGLMWWLASRGHGSPTVRGIASTMLGVALGFHLAMTGEHLQERAEQVGFETRLMTLTIAGLASLLITGLCLPLALSSFSIPGMFAVATANTRAIYAAVFQTLF